MLFEARPDQASELAAPSIPHPPLQLNHHQQPAVSLTACSAHFCFIKLAQTTLDSVCLRSRPRPGRPASRQPVFLGPSLSATACSQSRSGGDWRHGAHHSGTAGGGRVVFPGSFPTWLERSLRWVGCASLRGCQRCRLETPCHALQHHTHVRFGKGQRVRQKCI